MKLLPEADREGRAADRRPGHSRSVLQRGLNLFGRLLVVAVFFVAAWLLYREMQHYTLAEIYAQLRSISPARIAIALVLTAFNYVILVGYDWLAVNWIGQRLSLRRIALAAFAGYTFSYNFGATLFGTSIRYRLYSSWGVPLLKIVELLLILGLTFWFGLFALAGTVFLVDPLPMPQELAFLPVGDIRWLGAALLAMAAVYVGLAAAHRGQLALGSWRVPLPPFRLTVYQIVIASADLMVAAAVLYTLLPADPSAGYIRVLSVFMLAFVIAVLSHVPGGYGVLELTIVTFLPGGHGAAVAASLIAFRVIYFWIPLLFGAACLATHELTLRGTPGDPALAESADASSRSAPAASASTTPANANAPTDHAANEDGRDGSQFHSAPNPSEPQQSKQQENP